MPKPIDPTAWHPRKPPIEGHEHPYNRVGIAGLMVLGWIWRHKIIGALFTVLLALLLVVAIIFALLRVTDTSPPPAQTSPTPTLIPANGG